MKNKNLGMNVRIKYTKLSPWGAVEEVRHNVTEIHYLYDSVSGVRDSIAFESDVHRTGGTVKLDHIEEFEAIVTNKKADYY